MWRSGGVKHSLSIGCALIFYVMTADESTYFLVTNRIRRNRSGVEVAANCNLAVSQPFESCDIRASLDRGRVP